MPGDECTIRNTLELNMNKFRCTQWCFLCFAMLLITFRKDLLSETCQGWQLYIWNMTICLDLVAVHQCHLKGYRWIKFWSSSWNVLFWWSFFFVLFVCLFLFSLQEVIDIFDGVRDDQALCMAANLGFKGPLQRQVMRAFKALWSQCSEISDTYRLTDASSFTNQSYLSFY